MIGLLLSQWKLVVIGLLVAAIGVQTWRIDRLHHDLDHARDRVNAAQAATARCQNNRRTLETARSAQNAAVARLGQESARHLAEAQNAVRTAQSGRVAAERRAAALMRPATGSTVCERLQDVDRRVLESLR